MDEPSNDLDVEALRALEVALLEFAASVLVISRDRWFLDRIATHILAAEGDSQRSRYIGHPDRPGLDTPSVYGIMRHMADAELLLRTRTASYGGVVEMVVWRVPEPVPPSSHNFKYRLVFLREGKRVVGYDNERGKGDHRHLRAREVAYRFVDVNTLMQDFLEDVEAVK